MEEWLIKKKLNEAYKVSQLRDSKHQQDIDEEARRQINQGYNPKNFKMWLTQQNNQARYQEMEKMMMQQM